MTSIAIMAIAINNFTITLRLRRAYHAHTAAIALSGIAQMLLLVLATESIAPMLINTKICTSTRNGIESSTPAIVNSEAFRNLSNAPILGRGCRIVSITAL